MESVPPIFIGSWNLDSSDHQEGGGRCRSKTTEAQAAKAMKPAKIIVLKNSNYIYIYIYTHTYVYIYIYMYIHIDDLWLVSVDWIIKCLQHGLCHIYIYTYVYLYLRWIQNKATSVTGTGTVGELDGNSFYYCNISTRLWSLNNPHIDEIMIDENSKYYDVGSEAKNPSQSWFIMVYHDLWHWLW